MAKKRTKKEDAELEDEEVEETEDEGGEDVEDEEVEDEDEDDEPEQQQNAVAKGKVIFVNREKLGRAEEILRLVSGKRVPRNLQEQERKDHYSQILAADGVKTNDADALRYVYETLLGGLIRTPEQQKVADQNAAKQKAKLKKKKIEE